MRLEELGVLSRRPWDRCSAPTVLPEAGVDLFGSGWESPESSDSGLSVLRVREGAVWRARGWEPLLSSPIEELGPLCVAAAGWVGVNLLPGR